jgi:hypothetical protein
VGHEQQDIDEEAQQAEEEVENADQEEDQKVAGRVGRAVEMGDDSKDEHDKGQEGRDRVDDEERRKSGTCRRGKIEVLFMKRS